MLTLLFGMFAFFWTVVFSVVGLTFVLGLLIPFLLLALLFRIGFFIFKLAAGVVLLALFAVCLF
jgi:hypothetical protein